jgi:hypothetical protein
MPWQRVGVAPLPRGLSEVDDFLLRSWQRWSELKLLCREVGALDVPALPGLDGALSPSRAISLVMPRDASSPRVLRES